MADRINSSGSTRVRYICDGEVMINALPVRSYMPRVGHTISIPAVYGRTYRSQFRVLNMQTMEDGVVEITLERAGVVDGVTYDTAC